VRERVVNQVLNALPALSDRLQVSKEKRFAQYLFEALRELWHKTERLTNVEFHLPNIELHYLIPWVK